MPAQIAPIQSREPLPEYNMPFVPALVVEWSAP